ncbi:MAG: response regulator transcription factor [Gudongella sp.]|nr:response regulator transcription factor [Gudongella sp.]
MDKIRVMLIDDQVLLREGLKTIVNLQDDMEVLMEADNGQMALEMLKDTKIDVILMDIRMPVMNGVKATAAIKKYYPGTAIIILTTFDDDDYIIEALSNGADGYLLKDIDAHILIESIREAHGGQMMLPAKIASKLASHLMDKHIYLPQKLSEQVSDLDALTQRELEIGKLMSEGMSNNEIAKQLYLSEGTVKNYVSEIYSKLGTNNRMHAVTMIMQLLEQNN